MSLQGGNASGGTAGGQTGWNAGTWSLNMGGSGTSYQAASASAGMSPFLIAGLAVLAYLALRK